VNRIFLLGIAIFAAVGILIGYLNYSVSQIDMRCAIIAISEEDANGVMRLKLDGQIYEQPRLPDGSCPSGTQDLNINAPEYAKAEIRLLDGQIL
jgi:hypothetical protein